MERLAIAFLAAAALAGCTGKDDESSTEDDSQTPVPDDSDTPPTDGCPAPGASACDNSGSIIRGWVAKDPDSLQTGWSGTLWIFMTHHWPTEGELGGDVKTSKQYKEVDLEDGKPFPFEIDMCTGLNEAMWSEDACGYDLNILLDKNGNATPLNMLPDENEQAHKVENLQISCEDDSPCLGTILLDCGRGSACFAFDNSEVKMCECADQTCNSDFFNCD